jgi:hypothetical protein
MGFQRLLKVTGGMMTDNLTPSQKDELLWQAGQRWGPLPWADVTFRQVSFDAIEVDVMGETIELEEFYPNLNMGYGVKTQVLVFAEPDK